MLRNWLCIAFSFFAVTEGITKIIYDYWDLYDVYLALLAIVGGITVLMLDKKLSRIEGQK